MFMHRIIATSNVFMKECQEYTIQIPSRLEKRSCFQHERIKKFDQSIILLLSVRFQTFGTFELDYLKSN